MLALLQRIRDIERDIIFITTILFSILAFTVFCYFLKRKFQIAKDIRNILKNDITMSPCYQNHLKNLQIKLMITNFVVIIVLVEIMFNLSFTAMELPVWVNTFQKNNVSSFPNWGIDYFYLRQIQNIAILCHIAIPCLLLKVLLLTYFHCPYRYTVMRWSIYIIVRIVFLGLILFCDKNTLNVIIVYPQNYHNEYSTLQKILRSLAFLADFFTYIIYSRRFYLHLKSREKEARLFKDRTTYLNERAICLHFKVASILVTIGLFALLFSPMIYPIISIPGIYIAHYNEETNKIMESTINAVENIGYIIYSLVFILNYLYMISLVVGSYLVQKRGLVHVNKKIKPIITAYHKSPHFARNFNSY